MAAGLGFKDFTTGEVLTAADVDGYLMQGIWVFADSAARDAAVTSPQEGNFAFLKDTNTTTYYTGSAWTNLDTTGMVNPMTTTGDMIYSSSGSTPARLGIGSTGNVLTVSGGVPVWSAPGGGSGITLIGTTTFSASSAVNVNDVFSSTYSYYIVRADFVGSGTLEMNMRLRVSGSDNTTSDYNREALTAYDTTLEGIRTANQTAFRLGPASVAGGYVQFSFFNPFATAKTGVIMDSVDYAGSGIEMTRSAFAFAASTSFTGFSLIPATGNITGTLRVYGLANS